MDKDKEKETGYGDLLEEMEVLLSKPSLSDARTPEEEERLEQLTRLLLGSPAPPPELDNGDDALANALEDLSRRLEWLSLEQDRSSRRLSDLADEVHVTGARRGEDLRDLFRGLGLGLATAPLVCCALCLGLRLLYSLGRMLGLSPLLTTGITLCVGLGLLLLLGVAGFSRRVSALLVEEVPDDEDDDPDAL